MLHDFLLAFGSLLAVTNPQSWVELLLKFFPFVLLLELPFYLLVTLGMLRYGVHRVQALPTPRRWPSVSCIITCYSEGRDVIKTIESLAYQRYEGLIEIIPVVDGAIQNAATLAAAREAQADMARLHKRRIIVLPKWQRGGRVSSLNAGLSIATGEVVMALDGDTSFDNDMVKNATRHFADPHVVGVAGNLRVRNARQSLVARLQSMEYLLSITAGRTGLSQFNIVNNISGAFGVFRRAFIEHLGGWDTGTAEDLNMTLRIKQYFGRHPRLRIVFDPHAVGHTDTPATWRSFFGQRLRWDGDLFYIFVRKYRYNLRPSLLGWRNFWFVALAGVLMQIVLPFLIVFYTATVFFFLPIGTALGIQAFVYLAYVLAALLYFLLYLVAVSDRPLEDLRNFWLVPIFPLFAFINRLHCAFSLTNEMFRRTHLDSSMAPWWVLKRTDY